MVSDEVIMERMECIYNAAGNLAQTRSRHQSSESLTGRSAVFLDRDGTVTKYCGFVTDRRQVALLPDAIESLLRLAGAGYCCVLVSNQSAIGRGMMAAEDVDLIHEELRRQLMTQGASLDAIYYCPTAPMGSDERLIEDSDRKPGPGMLLRAARDLNLDLSRSWMVGDRVSDVLAGINAGCRVCIRVRSGYAYPNGVPDVNYEYQTVDTLSDAVTLILAADRSE